MGFGETTSDREEEIAREIVDAAFKVHDHFGPGLLESVYESCLEQELLKRGCRVRRQVLVSIRYGEITVDEGFRIDLLVEELVVVEIKAVEQMNPIFAQQLKTYLRLTDHQLGLLINFNVTLIKDGIKRVICTRPS